METNKDLFGEDVIKDELLRDKFIEPPFSILDTKSGNWQRRKNLWKSKGIKSEVGRDCRNFNIVPNPKQAEWSTQAENEIPFKRSIFDPALCEVLYHWFVPEGGAILDPFAGGSVRGIVANYLGYKYTGIDIRAEQVESNQKQGFEILPHDNQPAWIVGDSNELLPQWNNNTPPYFDFVFSCPPYGDLEVYSNLKGDISNLPYKDFLLKYESIIQRSCYYLKHGGFACFVVGEFRNKEGYYRGFVPDTILAFEKAGMRYYNEAILLNSIASASIRAGGNMKSQKLVKIHQNVLIFKKP